MLTLYIYHIGKGDVSLAVLSSLQAGQFMVLLPAGTVFVAHKPSCTVGIADKATGK